MVILCVKMRDGLVLNLKGKMGGSCGVCVYLVDV